MIGASIVVCSLFLLSFVNQENQQPKRTEEYGQIVYRGSVIERTINGKTEVYIVEGEKFDGYSGKYFNTALMNELGKMNEAGYEIVNVSSSPIVPVAEIYLFKRKI